MEFLVDKWLNPDAEPEEVRRGFEAYRNYLESVRGVMPRSAFEFATSPQYWDHDDHRNLHDAWVESLTITETTTRSDRQGRRMNIRVQMLGAHHDLFIDLEYVNVHSYGLLKPYFGRESRSTLSTHGDWLFDEVRMSKYGRVVHEVRFGWGASWVIECVDILWRYEAIGGAVGPAHGAQQG